MSSLLCTVNKITELTPIPNRDRIEMAQVLGWNCIVQKNKYKLGDLVLFIPPDSILPNNMVEKFELEFLKKGGRVGVLKFKGAISQGLVLDNYGNWKEGEEVSSQLGITKWEAPDAGINLNGKQRKTSHKKRNPLFYRYTDLENIRHYPGLFDTTDQVCLTEKIHGTNFRVGYLERPTKGIWNWILNKLFGKFEFVYGSRTVQISGNFNYKGFYGEDVYGTIAKKYNMASICVRYPNKIFYGEIYGSNIQDLSYGKKELELAIFDIQEVISGQYLDWDPVVEICKANNLPVVPELYRGSYSVEKLKECTERMSSICPTQIAEGCVVKTLTENNHPLLGRQLLKSINPNYLTRKGGTELK